MALIVDHAAAGQSRRAPLFADQTPPTWLQLLRRPWALPACRCGHAWVGCALWRCTRHRASPDTSSTPSLQVARRSVRSSVRVQAVSVAAAATAPARAAMCPELLRACAAALACCLHLGDTRATTAMQAVKLEAPNYIGKDEVPASLLRPGIDDPERCAARWLATGQPAAGICSRSGTRRARAASLPCVVAQHPCLASSRACPGQRPAPPHLERPAAPARPAACAASLSA